MSIFEIGFDLCWVISFVIKKLFTDLFKEKYYTGA